MKVVYQAMTILLVATIVQGCATTTPSEVSPPPLQSSQSMDYMYRSPSYQLGHL